MTPTLTRDLPCIACGYNLRGLDPAARCPECGAPAVQSLDRQFFRDADPTWVRQTARALQLLPLAGVVWCGLVLFAGWVIPAADRGAALPTQSIALLLAIPPGPRPLGLAAAVCVPAEIDLRQAACLLLGVAFYTWTLFRLTAPPHPSAHSTFDIERLTSPRALLRYAAALYAGAALVFAYVAFAYRDTLAGGELAPVALGFLAVDALLVPGLYRHLATLALRIPDQRLARRAKWLMWTWIVLDLAVVLPILFYTLDAPNPDYLEPALIVTLLAACLAVPLTFLFNTHFATTWQTALSPRQFWAPRPPALKAHHSGLSTQHSNPEP